MGRKKGPQDDIIVSIRERRDQPMNMEYVLGQLTNLLAIDSPSGYTKDVTDYLLKEFETLGFPAHRTVKGGVIADLGGEDADNAIFVESHVDTLGAMVTKIKDNGCLEVSPVGGISANSAEGETVRIRTRDGRIYEGTYDVMEIVVDEMTNSNEETKALGIMAGDFVCFEPRTIITKSGYIKSRFLDDKLSTAMLLGYAKHLKDDQVTPKRRTYLHMTVFEEVGHGGSASIPDGVKEVLSVDMGCVGDGLSCKEHQVSICAKDSRGPYHYDVVSSLIEAAKVSGADFAVDVYERSHVDGVKNTMLLLEEYLG